MKSKNPIERMLDGAIKREVQKKEIETVESIIPIFQPRNSYAKAAAGNAERLSK
jgi:hypothetical protein